MTSNEDGGYNQEIEMAGTYMGGVLGGLAIGAFGDIIGSEINSMAWYITGAVLGACAGALAGRIFRMVALAPEAVDEPHTERIRRAH